MATAPAALAAAGDECAKVLGYEWSGEKQSMDPADMHSGDDAYHIFAVYNRLVDVDDNFKVLPEPRPSGRSGTTASPGPSICAKASNSTTAATSTRTTWSTPFSASGIPSSGHQRRCFLKPENVKAVDPRTVTFTTEDPSPSSRS